MTAEDNKYQHRILTIPNALSLLRLLMIPLFVWLYIGRHDYLGTGIVLILSGITDTLDGFIARHFHMVSDLGKALDPVADKLTQIAMLSCLVTRYPMILLPLAVLIVKEITDGIMGLIIIKKGGGVHSADWHGKITTTLLYAIMILHVFWIEIPQNLSSACFLLCTAMMLLSFVLYVIKNTRLIRSCKSTETLENGSQAHDTSEHVLA